MTYYLGAPTLYQNYYATDMASWYIGGFSMTGGSPNHCGLFATSLTTSYPWLSLDTVNNRIGVSTSNPADVGTWAVDIYTSMTP
jgi:hypothetical protein